MPDSSSPTRGRVIGALIAAVAVGVLGAQILGEYEFEGLLPWLAGPLFGLVIAEVVLAVGKWRDPAVGLFAAAVAALSLVWAGWIDANQGVEEIKALVWVAAALGAVVAFGRITPLRRS